MVEFYEVDLRICHCDHAFEYPTNKEKHAFSRQQAMHYAVHCAVRVMSKLEVALLCVGYMSGITYTRLYYRPKLKENSRDMNEVVLRRKWRGGNKERQEGESGRKK